LDERHGIDTNPYTDKNYDFEIVALNGSWREELRFRKINGVPTKAIAVHAMDPRSPGSIGTEKWTYVDLDFPKRNGVGVDPILT
jgi:hypothetical protein